MKNYNLILSSITTWIIILSIQSALSKEAKLELKSNKFQIASSLKVNIDDLFFKIACSTKNYSQKGQTKYYLSKEFQAKFDTISYHKKKKTMRIYDVYTLGELPSINLILDENEKMLDCWIHWNVFAYNMQTEEILDINGYNLRSELKTKLTLKKNILKLDNRPYFLQKSNYSALLLK